MLWVKLREGKILRHSFFHGFSVDIFHVSHEFSIQGGHGTRDLHGFLKRLAFVACHQLSCRKCITTSGEINGFTLNGRCDRVFIRPHSAMGS